jgi:hypothetical protein
MRPEGRILIATGLCDLTRCPAQFLLVLMVVLAICRESASPPTAQKPNLSPALGRA